jgi:RimJ/RimL family protein N-acetyltransferase
MPVTLETPRLLLRKLRESDWEPYAAMCADPEVMRYLGTGAILSCDDAWRSISGMLGHWQLRGYGMWALESKETGEFLGRTGFLDPPGWPGFELGWVLAKPHWGHGYAIEAARVALGHAFDVLRKDRVISLIRPANARSIRVAQALGETLSGEVDLLGSKSLVYEIRAEIRAKS